MKRNKINIFLNNEQSFIFIEKIVPIVFFKIKKRKRFDIHFNRYPSHKKPAQTVRNGLCRFFMPH